MYLPREPYLPETKMGLLLVHHRSTIKGFNNCKVRTFRSAFIGGTYRQRQENHEFQLHLSLLV